MAVCDARRSALLLCLLGLFPACKSEAVAIEQCREIELARCEASVPCGTLAEDEVEECKRIYEDQCLHGIAGPSAPSANQQDACMTLIREAEEEASTSEPEEDSYERACAVIGEPWEQEECDFLNPAGEGGLAETARMRRTTSDSLSHHSN